jgi:hypothetical protein
VHAGSCVFYFAARSSVAVQTINELVQLSCSMWRRRIIMLDQQKGPYTWPIPRSKANFQFFSCLRKLLEYTL